MRPYSMEEQLLMIRNLLAQGTFGTKMGLIPTDIGYMKHLPELLGGLSQLYPLETLHWLGLLLNNPFRISLEEKHVDGILDLALRHLTGHEKVALRTIALLVHRTGLPYERNAIGRRAVDSLTFHMFLNSLSKLKRVECEDICVEDGIMIKRLKVKILSRGDSRRALEACMGMMSTEDSRLSWTLCKALVRICRRLEIGPVVSALKERCVRIFANEALWINIMTVLGMMVLNGWEIGDVDAMLTQALVYDNEFVHKSGVLREASYFLLWALIRAGAEVRVFQLAVVRALTDSSLTCRRAAASVVLEYVGRRKVSCGQELVRLVNFFTVKRLDKCSELLVELLRICKGYRAVAEDALLKNLFHYKFETKEQSAFCLARCFHPKIPEAKTPSDYIGPLLFVKEVAKKEKEDSGVMEGGAVAVYSAAEGFSGVLELELDARFFKSRDAEIFVKAYVEAVSTLGRYGDVVKKNLLTILSRNIHPFETARCCWAITDACFAGELVLRLQRNTEAFVLANAKSKSAEVEQKYLQNLAAESVDLRTCTMRAVRFTANPARFSVFIQKGLDDYHVDHRGDISWKLRKESMLAAFAAMESLTSLKYFIRYFVDKSKMLRDDCILICRRNGIFKEGFEFIGREGDFVDLQTFQPVRPFLDQYYERHRYLLYTTSLGNDRVHFKAALEAASLLDSIYLGEFLTGLASTISCSDAAMHAFLAEESSGYSEIPPSAGTTKGL
jgi:hypothetical protein